jgi:hypothetical protein
VACPHSWQLLRAVSVLTITNLNYEKQEMVLLVMVADPAGVGYIFLILGLLWLRAFNCRFRLGWGRAPIPGSFCV